MSRNREPAISAAARPRPSPTICLAKSGKARSPAPEGEKMKTAWCLLARATHRHNPTPRRSSDSSRSRTPRITKTNAYAAKAGSNSTGRTTDRSISPTSASQSMNASSTRLMATAWNARLDVIAEFSRRRAANTAFGICIAQVYARRRGVNPLIENVGCQIAQSRQIKHLENSRQGIVTLGFIA